MKIISGIFFVLLLSLQTNAQPILSIYENKTLLSFDKYTYTIDSSFHTSIQPYNISELKLVFNYDRIFGETQITAVKKWKTILLNKNFYNASGDNYFFTVDPLFDFGYGYDVNQNRSQWINTRGFLIEGSLGTDFAFSTRFYETQARLPEWIVNYIGRRGTVPGQGWYKQFFGSSGHDYASSSGYISWSPGSFFNFRAGYGKNFWGDGYRSLLLSDYSFNYPYFMITTTFWKIKYVNLYSQYSHPDSYIATAGDRLFSKKYSSTHYLSFIPWKRFNISLFETILWKVSDSTYHRGFDFNYINPVIFFRPVEFNLGSADNVLMGINLRYSISKTMALYGQVIIDEFRAEEILAGNGWHGNKYAWQLGVKTFDVVGVENLEFQVEYNVIRPYMYSHYTQEQNYSNAREPLAHPAGANTKEIVVIGKYNYKRLFLNAKYVWEGFGLDSAGINFGKDIFSSYQINAGEFGNYTTQGRYTTLNQLDLSVSLLVNPSTNMNLFLAASLRHEKNSSMDNQYATFTFGFRTSLRNIYYDFY